MNNKEKYSCAEVYDISQTLVVDLYKDIDKSFWKNRDAFGFRFDNIRTLAEYAYNNRNHPKLTSEEILLSNQPISGPISIYAGVPWCIQTCPFCSLSEGSHPSKKQRGEISSLIHSEIDNSPIDNFKDYPVNSCYFGGGTPTILKNETLCHLIDGVLERFSINDNSVITCETSPASITEKKLSELKHRVNRISVGVQSTNTELRNKNGRILSRNNLLQRLDLILDNFNSVNVDIMYGLPGQTFEHLYETIMDLVQLEVPSITLYRLELFPGTLLHTQAKEQEWLSLYEKVVRQFYFYGKILLEKNGYKENPLGWFIKKRNSTNEEEKGINWEKMIHNWGHVVPYYGFGNGGFSSSRDYWMQNSENYQSWKNKVSGGISPIERLVQFDDKEVILVKIMRMLRTFKYVSLSLIKSEHENHSKTLSIFFDKMVRQGLMTQKDDFYTLTFPGESLIHCIIDDMCRFLLQIETDNNTLSSNYSD